MLEYSCRQVPSGAKLSNFGYEQNHSLGIFLNVFIDKVANVLSHRRQLGELQG